jgi:hypothetical protein
MYKKDSVMYLHISDGLVVLNKPYGIGLSPPPTVTSQHSKYTDKILDDQRQYYLTEAVPHIAGNLGYKNLTVLKMPERFVFVLQTLTCICIYYIQIDLYRLIQALDVEKSRKIQICCIISGYL